ncbi:hypothetical protein LBMAG56_37460 [Verrucomicrobiota bacterium]|nr:hypothetical protein LBMAG56_37460 [Verrucomicrobiota bacterium]
MKRFGGLADEGGHTRHRPGGGESSSARGRWQIGERVSGDELFAHAREVSQSPRPPQPCPQRDATRHDAAGLNTAEIGTAQKVADERRRSGSLWDCSPQTGVAAANRTRRGQPESEPQTPNGFGKGMGAKE